MFDIPSVIMYNSMLLMRYSMAGFKIKTNRAAAKRFKKKKSGQFKRGKAYKSHILTKKTKKRKRSLREIVMVDDTNIKQVRRLLPNT